MQDTYSYEPYGTYEERRQLYLEFCAAQSPGGRTGFFSQIARLELGQDVDESRIREAIDFADSRQDCCDFTVGGLLRILYKYHDSPNISRELIQEIEACILRFKYWWDEPKGDNKRCYWTENHQIIFHADELLAGQLFPDQTFSNSEKDGNYHIEHALHLIRRWFDFRARFGFSEWLSNCYFEEDFLALVNLHDFAEQEDIRHLAKQTIDMLMFEMAMHTHRGVMGCSHGRTYPRLIKGGRTEDATNTAKLMFGMGLYNSPSVLGTVPLATSPYRCPQVFVDIARDYSQPRIFKERQSINMDDAPQYDLSYDNLLDGNLYLSVQDYNHEKVFPVIQQLRETYGIRAFEDAYAGRYEEVKQWQIAEYGEVVDPNIDCHGMTEVHIQTYRTANYMLSCAQDYRRGKPGYQQHPWQATFDIDAVVFTNHPGSDDEIARPNYWAGNGILPRAAQHENVLVCIHHVYAHDKFPFSHAYFPRAMFDAVSESGNWVCAQKGRGYIAVYTQNPYRWLEDRFDDNHPIIEMRVDSPDNIWVIEMGDESQWGDFGKFVEAVTSAPIECDGLNVTYTSPSQGKISFGWDAPFLVKGDEIDLHSYPRFDNNFAKAEFGVKQYTVEFNGQKAVMDFNV